MEDVLWSRLLANWKAGMILFLEMWEKIMLCRTCSKVLDVVLSREISQ